MGKTKQTFTLTALAAALLAAYAPAATAEDAALNQLTKPESSVSVGVGSWSDHRSQQGIYDGMRDDGAYLLLDADVVKRDDATGTWNSLTVRNMGLDNREVRLEHTRQGNYGVVLEYNQITREAPYTVSTGLAGIGTPNMTISGSGANALPLQEVNLGTERDRIHLGVFKSLMPGLDFKLSLRNEEKDGSRHWGLGSQPYFLAEPIDSTTRQLEATLSYVSEKLQLSGGYYGSWYDNANSMAWGLINGAAQPGTTSAPNPTPLSLPLDNQAHQFFVDGGYDFSSTTRGTFKLSYSHATQDDALATWGLAAPNGSFVGAPASLNGEVNTTLMQLGINSRPTPKLTLTANLRYNDVSDETPLAGFVGNNTTGAITVHNTPHSIQTTSGKAEANYRLANGFSLIGGVDLSRQDRSYPIFESERYVPFRSKLDEDTYRVQLRRSLSDTINGALAFLHSTRDGSTYLPTEHFPSDLINPIHIADRDRNKWRLTLDWTPITPLSVQFNYENAQDDYGTSADRPYGLKDGSARLYSADLVYTINPDWQVTAWYSHDETKATEYGARWDRVTEAYEMDKAANLKDTGNAVGLGVRGKVNPKLRVGADLQWVRNRSEYPLSFDTAGLGLALTPVGPGGTTAVYPTSGGVTATALPDIENKLSRLSLFAQYAVQKNADLRADVIFERWRSDDWTWLFSDGSAFTYGTTVDGTRVLTDPRQSSTFVGIRYIYKFQ